MGKEIGNRDAKKWGGGVGLPLRNLSLQKLDQIQEQIAGGKSLTSVETASCQIQILD